MSFSLDNSIALLERTPLVLDAWLRTMPAAWTRSVERPGTWCAVEIVAHLVFGEQTDWIPRTKQILAQGEQARLTAFDRSGHKALFMDKNLEELLDLFRLERDKSLRELRSLNLGPEQLRLQGIHPEFGAVQLDTMLAAWTAHDLAHMAQISRAIAQHYRAAVGPWRNYLSILGPLPSNPI